MFHTFLKTTILFLALTLTFSYSLHAQSPILWTASWSPDGAHVLVGGNDGILRVFDGESFELIRKDSFGSESTIQRMNWHPKENVVALGMTGSEFYLLNFDTGEKTTFTGDFGWTRGIGWNHNGKLLAAADGEGVIHIWDRKGEKVRTITKGDSYSYVDLAWHPKKDQIIGLSKYLQHYNSRGKLLQKTQHRAEDVLMLCADWHPSGKFFALGDYGDMNVSHPSVLQFWAGDGSDLQEFWDHKSEIRNLRWSPDGEYLATASDALRIYNKEGELLHTGASPDKLWGIDWSPDGSFIITSGEEGSIIVWNKEARLVRELKR